jgi:hypothetical protein
MLVNKVSTQCGHLNDIYGKMLNIFVPNFKTGPLGIFMLSLNALLNQRAIDRNINDFFCWASWSLVLGLCSMGRCQNKKRIFITEFAAVFFSMAVLYQRNRILSLEFPAFNFLLNIFSAIPQRVARRL